MKSEDSMTRTATIIGIITGVTITTCILVGMWLSNQRAIAAFNAGLVEGTVKGEPGIYWVKPE